MWKRLRFFRRAVVRPAIGLVVLLFTLISHARDVADFLSPELAASVTVQSLPEWPWYIWMVGVAIILLVAVFDSAFRLVMAAEEAAAQARRRATQIHQIFDSVHGWNDVQERFRGLIDAGVKADWALRVGGNEEWAIEPTYGDKAAVTRAFNTACELAADLLERTSHWSSLPESIKSCPNRRDRWLLFVKFSDRLTHDSSQRSVVDGVERETFSGQMENAALSSKRLCSECAAREKLVTTSVSHAAPY